MRCWLQEGVGGKIRFRLLEGGLRRILFYLQACLFLFSGGGGAKSAVSEHCF